MLSGTAPYAPTVDLDGVDPDVLVRLRATCLALPDAHEEAAWVGRRWRVRTRTFAHVFAADHDSPPSLARIAAALGPCTMVVFRSSGPELDALLHAGPPFFQAGWGRDVIGLRIDDRTDWDEVAELLTESYCTMAPRKLAALVERPAP